MNFIQKIKQFYQHGDTLNRLIFVNVAVFVVLQVVLITFRLFNQPLGFVLQWLALPADLTQLMYKPWTLLSYMFLHERFFHILFNMFALYWFGKLFQMFFTNKQLIALYILGGLSGAVLYILAYNTFPFFAQVLSQSLLLGASGSIMAIILAVAFRSPNMEMRLMFLGAVKLKYIALFVVLSSFFGITSDNAGGEIAHLGGALLGYLFVLSLNKGKDITAGLNRMIDFAANLTKPRKLKVRKTKKQPTRKMTDAEYNVNKTKNMAEIDRILDKIKTSGYESLTAEEKRHLFEKK